MTRYWGRIGLNRGYVETEPGVYNEVIDEVEVQGDMREQRARWPQAGMREGISVSHILSIVTPEDSEIDFNEAVYVEWQRRKWAVVSITYRRPRVELTLGGFYNG